MSGRAVIPGAAFFQPQGTMQPSVPRTEPKRQALIDEFGECDRHLRLWKPITNPFAARHAELEAVIIGWAAESAPDESTVLAGKAYEIEISARGFKREFSAAAQLKAYNLLKRIKGIDMMRFFSVTLAEAKALLGDAFLAVNVPKLQTGNRSLRVVPRAEAQPARGKAA
jgi:hypothetical protein